MNTETSLFLVLKILANARYLFLAVREQFLLLTTKDGETSSGFRMVQSKKKSSFP